VLDMPKTVTLRLSDKNYEMFKKLAERDNRHLSNFIETSVKRHIEHNNLIDEFEMQEILNNPELLNSIKRGINDAKSQKGKFIE
jgi:predicted DNA-binding protein